MQILIFISRNQEPVPRENSFRDPPFRGASRISSHTVSGAVRGTRSPGTRSGREIVPGDPVPGVTLRPFPPVPRGRY